MIRVGDVAGCEHAGRVGPEELVDADPVAGREARLSGELGPRLHADADDDEVALDRPPVNRADALDRRVALHRCSAWSTTPTPLGCSSRWSQSAIWVVRRSWI